LKRQKSASSQAASISAWYTVFDCPSMVAALIVSRHGPVSSSAARRKTAARSFHGVRDQSWCASRAAAIACSTSPGPPLWYSASTCSWLCGLTDLAVVPVRTSSPPITIGISICWPLSSSSRCFRLARSGDPGA
jgi:hypothetical protein